MARDLRPEDIVKALDKGVLAPYYLFYGPNEFIIERILSRIKDNYIPEGSRDLNMEICYGGEAGPSDVVDRALTLPFLASNRLIILRRTDAYKADQLIQFIPYLENPADSTCLIFLSSKTDFRNNFYKKIRSSGLAVDFSELKNNQVVPWIINMAKEIGLNINRQGCMFLQELTGNRLRDIYSELQKLKLSHGDKAIGEKEVRELAINSRMYTIFELMDAFSVKNIPGALSVLKRFLEEEDKKNAPLQIIGMLNRQIILLWKVNVLDTERVKVNEIASKLAIAPFSARNLLKQSANWSSDELERGITLLYEADRLLKSGSRSEPVLENLIFSLCG
ncbi:DNA polymerase III subunit delta [Thermodesulfobacteriota bacterium]